MKQDQIHIVEIAQVLVANPRPRNPVKFQAIVASIETVGLKRPILVNQRASAEAKEGWRHAWHWDGQPSQRSLRKSHASNYI